MEERRNTVAYADEFARNNKTIHALGRLAPFLKQSILDKRSADAVRPPPETISRTLARHAPSDVRLPRMVYAAVGTLPRDIGPEAEHAIAEMRKAPGVLHVISYGAAISFEEPLLHQTGIAVIARGYWLARQSLARLLAQCGGYVLSSASRVPVACADGPVARGTAQFIDDHLRIWHATADAVRSRMTASRIAGVAEEYIHL